jgi:hypothetical protein
MASQAGIIIEGANQPHKAVDNIPRPSPEGRQVLVKCLAVGLNPMYDLEYPIYSELKTNSNDKVKLSSITLG